LFIIFHEKIFIPPSKLDNRSGSTNNSTKKVFINSNDDGKIAFIQKGNDYIIIEKYIDILIEKEIIQDLLSGKIYTNYKSLYI
jgi:hypothetical protein